MRLFCGTASFFGGWGKGISGIGIIGVIGVITLIAPITPILISKVSVTQKTPF